ncbi:MAG: hypothetical protein AAF705_04805, partial [Bacteroidota bacterium]
MNKNNNKLSDLNEKCIPKSTAFHKSIIKAKHTLTNQSLILVFGLIGLLMLSACQTDQSVDTPDVSDIEVNLELRRFEQDLFQLDTNQMEEGLAQLEQRYPAFAALYFGQLMGAKSAPEGFENYVKGFVTFPEVRKLYDTTTLVFDNLDRYQEELTDAFRYYKYYFPEKPTPQVTTYLSEYTIGSFIYG